MIEINWNPARRDLRIFSVLLVAFSGLITWWITRGTASSTAAVAIAVGVAGTVALAGWFYLPLLRWTYVGLSLAVSPIGFVVSYMLMAVVYYVVLTPIGLLMRLCGRDPMHRRFDPAARSYWIARERQEGTSRYFRQF